MEDILNVPVHGMVVAATCERLWVENGADGKDERERAREGEGCSVVSAGMTSEKIIRVLATFLPKSVDQLRCGVSLLLGTKYDMTALLRLYFLATMRICSRGTSFLFPNAVTVGQHCQPYTSLQYHFPHVRPEFTPSSPQSTHPPINAATQTSRPHPTPYLSTLPTLAST